MSHQHIREEKIVDYVLGELSSEEHFQINAHLAICPKCASERDQWEKYLHVKTIPTPPPRLKHKIFLNIHRKRNRWNKRFAYVAMSLCVVFIGCIGILSKPQHIVHDKPSPDAQHEDLLELTSIYPSSSERLGQLSDVDRLYMNVITTNTMNDQSWVTPTVNNTDEQIIFATDRSICKYEPDRTKITCIEFKINSETNQFMRTGSKTYYLN